MTTLISLLICLWFSPSNVESLTFQIVYKNREIGEMTVQKQVVGKRKIYTNTTTVRARLIGKIEVQYRSKTVFEDGILKEASVVSLLNGDEYDNTETRKVGNDYQFYKEGKFKHSLEGPITYSAMQMYFEEPTGISKAYSEEAGSYHTIQSNENEKYSKVNSRGRTNYYFYRDQYLNKIEVDAGIFEIDMVRNN